MLKCSLKECNKNRDGACGLLTLCTSGFPMSWLQWKEQGCLMCKDMEKVIIPLEEGGPKLTGKYAEMWRRLKPEKDTKNG